MHAEEAAPGELSESSALSNRFSWSWLHQGISLILTPNLCLTVTKQSFSPFLLSHRLCSSGPPTQPELGRRQRLHPRLSQEPCLPCLGSYCPADLGWYVTAEPLRTVWAWTCWLSPLQHHQQPMVMGQRLWKLFSYELSQWEVREGAQH